MTETMIAPVQAVPVQQSQHAVTEGSFERGEGSSTVFESLPEERVDAVVQEDTIEQRRKGDEVLDFVKEHGIEDGFDFVANGFNEKESELSHPEDDLPVTENGQRVGEEVQEDVAEEKSEKIDAKKDSKEPESKTEEPIDEDLPKSIKELALQEEFENLQKRVHELTEGHEDLRRQLEFVANQTAQTMEITRQTVMVLYELVKKLHEEEEDKRRKNSLLVLLVRLTGFLTTSLMAGLEEGEKVMKKTK